MATLIHYWTSAGLMPIRPGGNASVASYKNNDNYQWNIHVFEKVISKTSPIFFNPQCVNKGNFELIKLFGWFLPTRSLLQCHLPRWVNQTLSRLLLRGSIQTFTSWPEPMLCGCLFLNIQGSLIEHTYFAIFWCSFCNHLRNTRGSGRKNEK